jgi:hypothetical protein
MTAKQWACIVCGKKFDTLGEAEFHEASCNNKRPRSTILLQLANLDARTLEHGK